MKRRDGRVYIAVDHGITEHPKIERLSDAAFRALVECWCWCSRNETDGRMPKPSWSKRVPVALATELLDGCLAHDRGEYVEMHDYTEHQRTAEEIKALREKRSAAGSKGGLAKAANRVASATADAKQTGSKSVAETETETETSKNSGARKRGTRLPDDWKPDVAIRTAMASERPDLDLIKEHEKFCDYWHAAAGARATKLDWNKTWRLWMRNQNVNRSNNRHQDQTDDYFAKAEQRALAAIEQAERLEIAG